MQSQSQGRHLSRYRAHLLESYPRIWDDTIAARRSESSGDRVWMLYCANYLFRTQGVRWAVDPVTLKWRLPRALAVQPANLENLAEYSKKQFRRVFMLLLGASVLVVGIAMIVLPGPAIIVIPAGLAILGTEFL